MIADPVVIVVDMQNDFCKPGYAHDQGGDFTGIQAALEAAGRFLARYRASGRTPILVRTVHDPESTSAVWRRKYENRPVPCRPGSEGAAFVPEIDVQPSDVVVTKRRYDAFYDTDLDTYLGSNDVDRVLVGGVSTNVCVESTVRAAFDRDHDVTLLTDCTGSIEPDLHASSLRNVDAHFGALRESDEIDLDDTKST